MHNHWFSEFIRVVAITTAFGLLGFTIDLTETGIIIGLLVSLLTIYQQIYRFSQWLEKDRLEEYQNDMGLIDNLYHRSYYLQKSHDSHVNHLETVIRRFQESARALPDAVIILNARNEVVWLNKAARKLVGLKRKKDTGQIISNLIRHPEFTQYLSREKFKYPVEFPSPINDEIQISARIVRYGKDMRLLVIRNITQLHNLEKMRSEFIASTSHELRTPLTVIMGYLEALQEIGDKNQNSEVINAMLSQSKRMESIIRDMLQLTRLESLQKHKERSRRPVDIPSLLAQIHEDALTVDASTHSITLDMDEHINLLGSEQELHSAFNNLVQNATRYTPDNSNIRISWKERNNGLVRYMVEDDGPGIAQEHIARLTERFYRVDNGRSRDKGGTGLGLAIVKQVMKQHDGQLLIESKPGKGSRFICEFPSHLVLNQLKPQIKAVG